MKIPCYSSGEYAIFSHRDGPFDPRSCHVAFMVGKGKVIPVRAVEALRVAGG
jgi:hypothetical protein